MSQKEIYRHADSALQVLYKIIGAEFQDMAVGLRFDELNTPKTKKAVAEVYRRINVDVKREYRKIARKVYKDTETELGVEHKDFTAMAFVTGILTRADPITEYIYIHEWTRKRDRLVESLMAVRNRQELREALRMAMNLMANQVRQYADNITDDARLVVFETAGVKTVQWNTQRDRKVCPECQARDRQIYKINAIPDKHHRCRCYLTAKSISDEREEE